MRHFKKRMANRRACYFFLFIFLFSVSITAAQNKVVVVPLVDNQKATGSPAPVPKTGQTTSYATGDDGELEEGVAWPNPRFTDNGDGTVTDALTGLIWLKDLNCFGSRTWETALNDCNTLNSNECGLTDGTREGDWRLPNIRELQSLIDYGQNTPALPSGYYNYFTSALRLSYWSSTTYADGTGNAWYIRAEEGYAYFDGKTSYHHVWPVRGGN